MPEKYAYTKKDWLHPKAKCYDDMLSVEDDFMIDVQYYYAPEKHTHKFYHFKTYKSFKERTENVHAFEVIYGECKLYFDIEFYERELVGDEKPGLLFDYQIKPAIQRCYETYFNMTLNNEDMYVSSTKPRWCERKKSIKWSYHIVVSNGYFFKTNKEIKPFIEFIKSQPDVPEDVRNNIDLSPYDSKQSFKLPYQSKITETDETVVQKIINGDYERHLVQKYKHDVVKGYYKPVIKTTQKTLDAHLVKDHTLNTKETDLDVGKIVKTSPAQKQGSVRDSLRDKLLHLGNEDLPWETWFSVLCAIKNTYPTEQGKSTFMEWSKLSKKHDLIEDTSNVWDKLKKPKDGKARTLKTIDDLLKKKYPEQYRDEQYFINSITKVSLNVQELGYDTKTIDTRYCSNEINLYNLLGFNEDFKTTTCSIAQDGGLLVKKAEKVYTDIVLKSHLGTGKSTIIENLLEKHRFDSILVISPRVMFGNSIYQTFRRVEPRLKFYKDIEKTKRDKHDFIVCQLESLATLKDKFELVILDEVESILNQFQSTTMHNVMDYVIKRFEHIIKNATYLISADAFVLDRSIDVLSSLRKEHISIKLDIKKNHIHTKFIHRKKLYIENTHNPYKRWSYYMGKKSECLTQAILNDIQKNPENRRIITTGSRPHSDNICDMVQGEGQSCLKINRLTDDKYTKEIRDVEMLWSNYQNVVYTSSITVGVNYDIKIENLQFDKLFIHFSANGCLIRDSFQSSLRARTIKKNQLYYTMYDRYDTTVHNNAQPEHGLMRTFKELYDWKKENVRGKLPEWAIKVWAYNELESTINRIYFKKVVQAYLTMCGYIEYLLPKEKLDITLDTQKNGLYDIHDIKLIDEEVAKDTYQKICCSEATTDDKLEYLKHTFVEELHPKYVDEIDIKTFKYSTMKTLLEKLFKYWSFRRRDRKMFEVYQQNPTRIDAIIHNTEMEINSLTTRSVYIDNLEERCKFIKGLNNVIGLKNSFTNHTFERDCLKKVVEYLNNFDGDYKRFFRFDKNKNLKNETDKNIIGTLNTIYTEWSGMAFVRGGRKRKMINGVRLDVSPIEFKPYTEKKKDVVVVDMSMFVDVIRRKNTQKEVEDMFKIPDFGGKCMLRWVDGDEI